jgi:hypothetical protein
MVLVKALEARKRLEERERKRQEVRAEKMASKERKLEQRRIELELVRELRKPVEDMEISGGSEWAWLHRCVLVVELCRHNEISVKCNIMWS